MSVGATIKEYMHLGKTTGTKKLNFKPNIYKNISRHLNKKFKFIYINRTEFKKYPFPKNKKVFVSLALLKVSEFAFKYAEAFILLKKV